MQHARRIALALGVLVAIPAVSTNCAKTEPTTAEPQKWQLVEDLRIGSDSDQMTMFTDIRGVVEGADGKIFILDHRPQEIRVFDRAGKFLALAARRGQGPGEISSANGMILLDGTLWVNDPENGRWSAHSAADGRYLRQMTIPIPSFGYLWQAATDAEGRILDPIYVRTSRMDPATGRPISEQRVRRVRVDDSGADTIAAPDCTQRAPPAKTGFSGTTPNGGGTYMAIPFLASPLTVLDGRAGYWCSPNDEYVLVHRSLPMHDTLHTVRMPYTRVPVTAEQRNTEIENVRKTLAHRAVVDADYSLIPPVHPVFERFDVDDKGQLWARRVAAPGGPTTSDVYDQAGRAVATITTTIVFARALPLHVKGDNVYGVVRDADDVQHIVRARIVRPPR